MIIFWIASLMVFGGVFYRFHNKSEKYIPIVAFDFYALLGLFLFFAPIYFLYTYSFPWQINSDELVVMRFVEYLTSQWFDPFSESYYYGFPRFAFILLGIFSKFFGEISLDTLRNAQGLLGLLSVLFSYFLFRQMLSNRWWALGASFLLGSNHSFLAISRMGIWTHTAIFIEIPALALLFSGFQRRSLRLTFLGGVVAGLSFYVYFAGRFTFVIWFFFLVAAAVLLRRKISFSEVIKLAVVSFIGFIIVASPMFINLLKPSSISQKYIREQVLFFPEAQKELLKLSDKETVGEAIFQNIQRGLTIFNNNIIDHGSVYANFGHGFVDPFTGILIWFGFVFILIKLIFKLKVKEGDLFSETSFFFIWLFMSLIVSRAPNYTRMMIILPFTIYLSLAALKIISTFFLKEVFRAKSFFLRIGQTSFSVIVVLSIIFWNLLIYYNFIQEGIKKEDVLGGTYRYMETKKSEPEHYFYLSASEEYLYFPWSGRKSWEDLMRDGVHGIHQFKFYKPEEAIVSLSDLKKPFTYFLSQKLWYEIKENVFTFYPEATIKNITASGTHIAVEVF